MAESAFSSSWYRVAELKPRLRSHAQVYRHTYRGQLWYVAQDRSSGRYHRLSPAAHALVGLMNGERSVSEIWRAVTTRLGDDAPTQEETIELLSRLHAADLLQCDVPPDSLELFQRYQSQRRARWAQSLLNPLALRFPLFDPERLLNRGLPLVGPLFGWLGALVWLAVVGAAVVLAAAHWTELTQNVADRVLRPQNLILLWLIYPIIKTLHEFGHAFATKVWGGEVHEMGIMFLVLMPIPYVDASASSAFRERRQRMLVGAAGIFVELFAASLALFAWLNLEPGALRSVAYNVMLIGGVSTVFFNGNPLLRFDGYYILADAVGIPNLAARSRKHLGYLVQRHLFGLRDVESPATAPGERAWFVVYGIASVVYRLFILGVIVLFIAGKFFVVGVALAVWVALSQLVMPVVKGAAFVFTSPRVRRKRARALATTGLLALTLATLLFLLPVPSRTRAEGVVWLPERSQVRAGSEGFIRRILALPEAHVEAGDALIELEDPLLRAHVCVLEAELRAIRARHYALLTTNRIQAEILAEEVATVEANLARTRERADALILRSPGPGTFVVPRAQDLPGRFVRQGELIAFVTDFSTPTARVVVSQADIGLVRERTRAVEVRLAERIARPIPARILREVPAATNRLPSRALGTAGGGRFPVDPSDPEGTATLERVFQFDLELPAQVVHIGGRVHVRFDHGREAVATQSYRLFRRLFLSRFNV